MLPSHDNNDGSHGHDSGTQHQNSRLTPNKQRGKKQIGPRRDKKTFQAAAQTRFSLDPSLYINRELSWLEFNERVIEEARDKRHPLLERIKFLSIVSSNLDEFFMIRVAGIQEQVRANFVELSPDGMTPGQQLKAIHGRVSVMLKDMRDCFWNDLHPALSAAGIHLLTMNELKPAERSMLADLFAREIFPVLTPLAFDPGHPFPYISNLSLNIAVVVATPQGDERFARVKVPDVISRLVQIPNGDSSAVRFVWLEDLISENLSLLFPGMKVKESYVFRVTRNADMDIQEDEAEDLISSIEELVRMRRYGSVVRVAVQSTMPARIKEILIDNLEAPPDGVFELPPPMGLSHLMSLLALPRPDLKDPPYHPAALVELYPGIRPGVIPASYSTGGASRRTGRFAEALFARASMIACWLSRGSSPF